MSVEVRLAQLETKVDEILNLLRETHTNARRMDRHISTVETVIDQFQRPAYFVKQYIEKLMPGRSVSSSLSSSTSTTTTTVVVGKTPVAIVQE